MSLSGGVEAPKAELCPGGLVRRLLAAGFMLLVPGGPSSMNCRILLVFKMSRLLKGDHTSWTVLRMQHRSGILFSGKSLRSFPSVCEALGSIPLPGRAKERNAILFESYNL